MLLGLANAYRCGTFFRDRSEEGVKHTQRTLCMLRQERPPAQGRGSDAHHGVSLRLQHNEVTK